MNERITLNDTPMSIIIKLADGNPGALHFLTEILTKSQDINDSSFFTYFLALDSLGIYGTDAYVLWSDLCGRDTIKAMVVIRAYTLGMVDGDILRDACSRQDYSGKELIDVDDLFMKVIEKIPEFKKGE